MTMTHEETMNFINFCSIVQQMYEKYGPEIKE